MSLDLHAPSRRELLATSGVLFAWPFLPRLARAEGRDPRMLVIVLRGGLDGLAAVAPVGDPDWVALRGERAFTLAGQTPGRPLDSFFALNPAMPNLHRLYAAGHAAIVHAAATPYRERSHFDGQDVLESGLPKPGDAARGARSGSGAVMDAAALPAGERGYAHAAHRSLPAHRARARARTRGPARPRPHRARRQHGRDDGHATDQRAAAPHGASPRLFCGRGRDGGEI